jgi:putative ABC transport system permease protein
VLRATVAGLLAHRLRLILTAVTIVIGTALVAGTFILTDSLQSVLGTVTAATPGAMVVVQPAEAGGGKEAGSLTSLSAGLLARIKAVPGAASAEGLVTLSKVDLIGRGGRPIIHSRAPDELMSYPAVPVLAAQYTVRVGRPPRRPGEAMLDAATARSLGYHVGDRIGIVTPAGLQTVAITGITGFSGHASPAAEQVASFDAPTVLVVQPGTAQRFAGLPGRFTEIDVLAATGVSAVALRDRIAPLLPPGAEALTGRQAASQQTSEAAGYLGNLRTDLLVFDAAALIVAALVIAGTFSLLTAQRMREYALLRLIGASRGQVLSSALTEAAMLGLAASAAGAGLGVLAAVGLRGLIALLGGTLPASGPVLAPRTIVVTLITGTAVTVVSALRPARRAAAVRPVRALREAAAPISRRSRGRLIAGITAATARLVTASAGRGRRSSATVLLARENAARNLYRTSALAAVLAAGLAAAIAVSVVATSAQAAAWDAVTGTSRADLYLQGNISPSLAAAVAAQPGVLAAMRADDPLVAVAGGPARVAGIDPGPAGELVDFGVRTGSLTVLRGDTVFVSTEQAARHGWRPGSLVPVGFGQGRPRMLRVAGTFADKRFFGDDYLMPITTLFSDMPDQLGEADTLLVRAAPGARPGAVQAELRALLTRDPDTIVLTAAAYRSARAADLGDIGHVLGLFTAIVVLTMLLAVLGIANALALSVIERVPEFAVMRALGLTRRQLAVMIRVESAITCLLGALPGIAAGTVAGAATAAVLTRHQTGVAVVAISPAPVGAAIAAACLAALGAGILPARQAWRATVPRAVGE